MNLNRIIYWFGNIFSVIKQRLAYDLRTHNGQIQLSVSTNVSAGKLLFLCMQFKVITD